MAHMNTQQQLSALAWAARQKGIDYGRLVANMTPEQEAEIYSRYAEHLAAERERLKAEADRRRKLIQKRGKPKKMQKRGWHL